MNHTNPDQAFAPALLLPTLRALVHCHTDDFLTSPTFPLVVFGIVTCLY